MKTFLVLIDRWFSSTKISAMHPEEEGGYFRLLLHAAGQPDCGLPDDDNELARFSRLGDSWFKRPKLSNLTRGERIRQCFFIQDGRLFNALLLEDRKKWDEIVEQKRYAGVRSGESRRAHSSKRSTGVEQELNTRSTGTRTEREQNVNGSEPYTNYLLLTTDTTPPLPPQGGFGGGEVPPQENREYIPLAPRSAPMIDELWSSWREKAELVLTKEQWSDEDWKYAYEQAWKRMDTPTKFAAVERTTAETLTDSAKKSTPLNFLQKRLFYRQVSTAPPVPNGARGGITKHDLEGL